MAGRAHSQAGLRRFFELADRNACHIINAITTCDAGNRIRAAGGRANFAPVEVCGSLFKENSRRVPIRSRLLARLSLATCDCLEPALVTRHCRLMSICRCLIWDWLKRVVIFEGIWTKPGLGRRSHPLMVGDRLRKVEKTKRQSRRKPTYENFV